jgi:hypothetical protein
MIKTMLKKQQGVSFSGFLVVVVIIILASIGGMKIVPYYIQDKTIKSKFDELAHDPELLSATPTEIRAAFSKRATVSDITSIKAEEIEVARDNGTITLSANYSVKIPLLANINLLLEFSPSSATK